MSDAPTDSLKMPVRDLINLLHEDVLTVGEVREALGLNAERPAL